MRVLGRQVRKLASDGVKMVVARRPGMHLSAGQADTPKHGRQDIGAIRLDEVANWSCAAPLFDCGG
jgi:hypothetical protein